MDETDRLDSLCSRIVEYICNTIKFLIPITAQEKALSLLSRADFMTTNRY